MSNPVVDFTIENKKSLLDSLNIVSSVIKTKTVVSSLQNVLITTDQQCLVIAATDFEASIGFWVRDIPIDGNWAFGVNGYKLRDILKTLDADKSTRIVVKNNFMTILQEGLSMKLPITDSKEMPDIMKIISTDGMVLFDVDAHVFAEKVKAVNKYCADRNTSKGRPGLACAQFYTKGGYLNVAGSDGSRAYISKVAPCENPESIGKDSFMTYSDYLDKVIPAIAKDDSGEPLHIGVTDNRMHLVIGNVRAALQCVEEKVIDFDFIVPSDLASIPALHIERQAALFAVQRASTISYARPGFYPSLSFSHDGNGLLTVHCNGIDGEEYEEKLPAIIDDAFPPDLCFNIDFIRDMLALTKEPTIVWRTRQNTMPSVFLPDGNDTDLHIIMPMYHPASG
jgi:DNA polymerase III sliding clamp (beta) subunit (PCNA family)